jgi:hypothetical protein
MFALFSAGFASLFVAFAVAAVVGHVLLIDVLLRPINIAAVPPGMSQTRMVSQPAPMIESRLATSSVR